MPKIFRPNNKESIILSKIDISKENARRLYIKLVRENFDRLCNSISMKLIETSLVETTSKNTIEEQINICCKRLSESDDFDIDYQIAPYRNLVTNPNIVGLYITSYVLETLINHPDIIDIYGSDEDIYQCITESIKKYLPQ